MGGAVAHASTFDSALEHDLEPEVPAASPVGPVFQVGPADDAYEREAEATAERVMSLLTAGGEVGSTLHRDPAVQRVASVGAAGGPVGGDTGALIAGALGTGAPLASGVRTAMESAFGGADFGAVRIHTGGTARRLNQEVSARAFTVGRDIFLGSDVDLESTDGQRVLAHELTHTQQQGGDVHRLFKPTTTTDKTTLRVSGKGSAKKQGRSIPKNTEIVVDRAQQVPEQNRFSANEVWVAAADVRADAWTAALAPTTYVRSTKLGPDKTYPIPEPGIPTPGRLGLHPQRRWNDQIGEYIFLDVSARGAGAEIVQKPGTGAIQTLIPPGTLTAPTQLERDQVDFARLTRDIEVQLKQILTAAANRHGLDPTLFAKDEHIGDNHKGLLKALRMNMVGGHTADQFAKWHSWKDGVIAKITSGADEAAQSIEYWRTQVYTADPTQVTVTDIEIDGSDLHDRGLGAIFVTFDKPGGPAKMVVKPEDRSIEKALFGDQAGSLASRMDRLAGLQDNTGTGGVDDRIAKIKMETHALHGSLIEFVQGTAARKLVARPNMSDAGIEAMVLAYIAGLSDVHQDNVIWIGDTPYFIDADNALNASRIGLTAQPGFEHQSGFTKYSDDARTQQDTIKNNPGMSTSKIMQALMDAGNPVPVVDAVRKTFTGKTGRVVPLFTNTWANSLKGGGSTPDPYYLKDLGAPTDAPSKFGTRWALANLLASWLPDGSLAVPEPGLRGESGANSAGDNWNVAVAAAQIKADLDQGKIPFFTYEYDTGHVKMNGQVVWHGAPLSESLEVLLARFPHQRNITDIP
jgi:hypothetical protein